MKAGPTRLELDRSPAEGTRPDASSVTMGESEAPLVRLDREDRAETFRVRIPTDRHGRIRTSYKPMLGT